MDRIGIGEAEVRCPRLFLSRHGTTRGHSEPCLLAEASTKVHVEYWYHLRETLTLLRELPHCRNVIAESLTALHDRQHGVQREQQVLPVIADHTQIVVKPVYSKQRVTNTKCY
jgi:hypothetical protein